MGTAQTVMLQANNDLEIYFQDLNENTRKEYRRDIEEFFSFMGIDSLHMIKNGKVEIMNKHIKLYRQHLSNKNGESTIVRKLSSIRGLLTYLKTNHYPVDPSVVETKKIRAKPNGYSLIKLEDAIQMIDLAKKEKHHADELAVCIQTLIQTSRRVESVLSIEYGEIRFDEEQDLYLVEMIDKGNEKYTVPIDKQLYEKMILIKKLEGKVFRNLNSTKVRRAIKKFAKILGLPENLRFTTHSLRQTASHFELKTSGNMVAAMEQTGHKSANVFKERYTRDYDVDYKQRAGIRMMKEVSEDTEKKIEEITKIELLELLKIKHPLAYQNLMSSL